MFRYLPEQVLLTITFVSRAGNYLAAAVALGIIAAWAGWITPPLWLTVTAGVVVVVLFVAGILADHELSNREGETELENALGHWPRRDEREDADAILALAEADEPVQVDDEGEAVR